VRRAAALAAVVAIAGCGNAGDEREASATVTRLVGAVERGDGAAACVELTEEAASSLENATGRACDSAILDLEVSPSPVVDSTVSVLSAQVSLAGGGSFFLDDTTLGWKVSAAGCEPRPGQPYDCQLEG
jgi:hypothetical protein